jgi:hypothetical protein
MKERPIIFSAESVRAILEGKKTQTRRVIGGEFAVCRMSGDNEPCDVWWPKGARKTATNPPLPMDRWTVRCPYGVPEDRLWARETYARPLGGNILTPREEVVYRADAVRDDSGERSGWWIGSELFEGDIAWHSPIHMPRWASRITLEIMGVRVERLQEINEDDAMAEGVSAPSIDSFDIGPVEVFADAWDRINAKRGYGWDMNPWVWVISFRRVECNGRLSV